jgi:hypothetical protein
MGGPILFRFPVSSDIFAFEGHYGAGGVVSTAEDMISWLDYLLKSNQPARQIIEVPTKKGAIPNLKDDKVFYSSGWIVDTRSNVVWHNGQITGYKAGAFMQVDSGLTAIFIFANTRFSKDEENLLQAWEDFFTKKNYVLPN